MSESKKIVIKVDVHDNEEKRKALKAVTSHPGIESIAMDMKDKKLTIVGDIDPVCAVRKLKKWHPSILTVGPAKDEKKKDDKKDDKKKDDKKDDKKGDDKKKQEKGYGLYYPYVAPQYCVHRVVEENPSGCVIC